MKDDVAVAFTAESDRVAMATKPATNLLEATNKSSSFALQMSQSYILQELTCHCFYVFLLCHHRETYIYILGTFTETQYSKPLEGNIGIKHGFPCINVCQVPREMLLPRPQCLIAVIA